MSGGRTGSRFRRARWALVTGVALVWPTLAAAQEQPASTSIQTGPRAPQFSSSTTNASQRRTIDLNVPLRRNQQVYGEVLVQVQPDGGIAVGSDSLRREMAPLLNEAGRRALEGAIAGEPFVSPTRLGAAGFVLRFDQSRLELVLETINPTLRPVETIGDGPQGIVGESVPPIAPADFSAYLNVNLNLDYSAETNLRNPDLFLFGAARYGGVVLEVDGAFTDSFEDEYRFYRRSVRLVYDEADQFRRWSAGDLRLETLPILRTPFIGGVAVEKRRDIFDPFAPVSRLGGRQILLDTPSTVDVLINGAPYQTFQLDSGTYDLADLPVRFGSNDIQLVIRDAAGRQQLIQFDYFFDPVDLPAGEEEYTLALGVVSRELNFEPDYTGDPVAVGAYRRALTDSLLLGGAAQISEDVQVFGAEASFVPQVIPGTFDLQAAVSNGDQFGFVARAAYRWRSADIRALQQFTLNVDYQSEGFQSVGQPFATDVSTLSLSASYTRGITQDTQVSVGGSYTTSSGTFGDRSNVYADVIHRIGNRIRLLGGIEYGNDSFRGAEFGVRIGATILFGRRERASADFRSRNEAYRLSYGRSTDTHVGSFGYEFSAESFDGRPSLTAQADYLGNRFEARAIVSTFGDSFGAITEEQRARVQVGFSMAYADGLFGVGRPITDSFALLRAHPALGNQRVIAGRDLTQQSYEAASGPLGAAVVPRLTSYNPQDVQYDIDSAEGGFDVGDGVARVDPAFRSGYSVVVGNARFVSAVGLLTIAGVPAELVTGEITSPDDEGFEPQPFFTNSVGRFGILGLAPGKSYVVTLRATGRRFTFEVPAGNQQLIRMGTVDVMGSER